MVQISELLYIHRLSLTPFPATQKKGPFTQAATYRSPGHWGAVFGRPSLAVNGVEAAMSPEHDMRLHFFAVMLCYHSGVNTPRWLHYTLPPMSVEKQQAKV